MSFPDLLPIALIAKNPLTATTMQYCGLILAICALIAFIVVKTERPRRRLAQAIDAIADKKLTEAYDLLQNASNYGYPENILCLAFVCAKLDKKKECHEALLKLDDYSSPELSHLIDFLEAKLSEPNALVEYINQSDYYYQQAEAPVTVLEDEDEDAFIDELNQKLDYAILCGLVECMIALLARDEEAALHKKTLVADPLFLWLHAVRASRVSDSL